MEFPDFVLKEMKQMEREYNQPISNLKKQYERIYNTDWIQSDEQFESDKDRHSYCIRRLWIDLVALGEEVVSLIPFGYVEASTTTKDIWQSKIYCYAKLGKEWQTIPLICQGDTSNLYKDLELFCGYKTQVNNFGNILMATENTEFTNGKPIPQPPIEFLTKRLGIKKINIAQSVNDRSKVNKDGFTEELDMRIIQGIIVEARRGQRKDGSNWAFYRITDESAIKSRTTRDGKIIPKRLMVWCPSTQQLYDVDSEIQAVGTVTGEREPIMNACAILPVHVREMEG